MGRGARGGAVGQDHILPTGLTYGQASIGPVWLLTGGFVNHCRIHNQDYSDFCVYCGPPGIGLRTGAVATNHICIPGEMTSSGQTCIVCGSSIPPPQKPFIWCEGELCSCSRTGLVYKDGVLRHSLP